MQNIDRLALGIPSEADYVSQYCERLNISEIANWNFYVAFSFFRYAAILQGIYKRGLGGNASSDKVIAVGKLTRPPAELAMPLLAED